MRNVPERLIRIGLISLYVGGLIAVVFPLIGQLSAIESDASAYAQLAETVQTSAKTELPVIQDTQEIPTATAFTVESATPFPIAVTEQSLVAAVTVTVDPSATPTANPVADSNVPNLVACNAINADFAAWLRIPGTVIDYPVVLSDRTEYYLHHLLTGEQSKLGCLFSLSSADYKSPGQNIAIYGHHLSTSNAMFSTLLDYKRESYWKSHPDIQLFTPDGLRIYRIFAAFNMKVSDWDAATASFQSDGAFESFVERAQKKALYDTGIEVTAQDKLLTLITCDRSYGGVSGRFIVMAVLDGEEVKP